MKRHLIQLTAACAVLAVGGFQARADKIPLVQVPEAVQKAIKEQSKGETVQDVERETKDGKVVYQAEFKREGINRRLQFNEDGSIITGDRGFADVTTSPALNRLPAPVQKTLEEQRAGRVVADIDQETWNGQAVYEVEFKERGPNSRIHIAQDGTLVMEKRTGRGLFMGTQLSDTPQAVQETAKRVAGNADIADVDKETWQGQTAYEVEIRQAGMNREILVAEDGSILRDSEVVGAAPSNTERTTVRERVRDIFDRGQTVSLEQTPTAVQKTIRDNTALGVVLKSIKKEQEDGVTRYGAEFEKEGKNTRLKIAEDGSIVKDNRQ